MVSDYHYLDYPHDNNYELHPTPPTDSNRESDSFPNDNTSRPSSSSAPGTPPKLSDQHTQFIEVGLSSRYQTLFETSSQTAFEGQEQRSPGTKKRKNRKKRKWSVRNYDWAGSWMWEIGGIILSVVCTCFLIGFLAYVNGMEYARWEYSISPNAVISVISAFAKASMLIPVSGCLGQLKWKKGRKQSTMPLYHFHVLDQASRGPWGALEVFWTVRSSLAMAGAALMVLSVALDPFAQQILIFPSREILALNETAYVQKAQEYYPKWSNGSEADTVLEPTMQTAILTGLAKINTPLEPACSSGSCAYPEFATLGICSECEDVTKSSVQTCKPFTNSSSRWETWKFFSDTIDTNNTYTQVPADCSYKTPSGFRFIPDIIDIFELYTHFVISRQPFTSISNPGARSNDSSMIVSILTARYNNELIYTYDNRSAIESKAVLTQCSIRFCEKQFAHSHVSVNNRTFQPSRSQPLRVNEDITFSSFLTYPLVPMKGHKTFSNNASYSIDVFTYQNLLGQMAALFNTTLVGHSAGGGREQSYLSSSGVQLAPILFSSNNTSDALSRMDESMTDNIRSSSKSTRISGKTYRSETFIQVRWSWLILPIALLVFTIFLLITMALASRDQPVLWKSSVFPLLMGQLQPVDEHNIAHLRHLDQVQSLSRRIKVRIGEEEGSLLFAER